ncbi:MAG TPA: hypothetical protein VFN35_17295 [Ktedonobacteraceae bacterium]|nr:hypothetical protein [Ktedonobacteraceae bacterium]
MRHYIPLREKKLPEGKSLRFSTPLFWLWIVVIAMLFLLVIVLR